MRYIAIVVLMNGLCAGVFAKVSMSETSQSVILSSGGVSVTIDKNNARIRQIVQNGESLLSPEQSGYFTLIAGDGHKLDIKNCSFQTYLKRSDTIDLCFRPERSRNFPFDIEIHYVMRSREPGFFFYLVASKDGKSPDRSIEQFRFAIRVDDSMRTIRLNDDRHGLLPSTADIKNSPGMMMDATYLIPDGDIVTKYEWSSPTAEAPVYGLHNGTQGIWMIRGGSDYLNGGPSKQHNNCHATKDGPILLNLFHSNHYGSRGSFVSGQWKKIFGPTFVYLNQANKGEVLWADAKKKEAQLSAAWPYKWMRHPEYSVERTSVSGRFENIDNGWVVLARPSESRNLDWQRQGGDAYIARAPIVADGSFKLSGVRFGSYTLYAYSDGVVGEFRKDNVVVDTLQAIELGAQSWRSRSHGQLLWRIGKPDRSAAEFRHGDDYRHWGLWFHYEKEFPNDVDFLIGKSQEGKDWNYAQMAVWQEEGGWQPKLDAREGPGSWKLPKWKIRFKCDALQEGNATLTLALAGVNRDGSIQVSLNGLQLGSVDDLIGDSSIQRNGIYGYFRERFISFDASLLKRGENVIALSIDPKKRISRRDNYSYFGVMYDFVQLEIGAKETDMMTDEQAFNYANNGRWIDVFNDACTGNWKEQWFQQRETYGGIWGWVGIHSFNHAAFMTGCNTIKVLAAQEQNKCHPRFSPGCSDYLTGLFLLDGNVQMTVSVDMMRPNGPASHGDDWVRIVGIKGSIEAKPELGTVRLLLSEQEEKLRLVTAEAPPFYTEFLTAVMHNRDFSELSTQGIQLTDAAISTSFTSLEAQYDLKINPSQWVI